MDNLPGEKSKFVSFTAEPVNVRRIELQGNIPNLSVFPDWVWYTPAPARLWGHLTDDVLYAVQQDVGAEFYQATFNSQIFSGLSYKGDAYWQFTLWAAPQTAWGKLKEELLRVTQVNTSTSEVIKYGLQVLKVPDPVAVQNESVVTDKTATLDLFCFGVMSNKYTIAFNPAQGNRPFPAPMRMKPEPGMVSLGDKVLNAGDDLGATADKFRALRIDGSDKRYDD